MTALNTANVDRARQLDECSVEAACGLMLADAILDVPERRVDVFESGEFGRERGLPGAKRVGANAERLLAGLLERQQLAADVGELGRILHATALDAQNTDLVEQLAGGQRNQDVSHARLW